jgi:phosphatidate cytidylyltransferase
MFKQRLITGLILIVIGYYFITIASIKTFLLVEAFITILCALEWSKIAKYETAVQKITFLLALLIAIAALVYLPIYFFGSLVVCWWAFALYWVLAYQQNKIIWPSSPITLGLIGVLIIAPLLYSAYQLKFYDENYGSHSLLFVIILIALTDMMAYFVGKTMGNYKLADKVSPKKTWEGIIGGVVSTALLSVPIAYWCRVTETVNPWVILPAVIIAAVSVLGDLTESVCKRNAGIKDSGNILPGHGGVLDRFDSYTSGVPIAYLLLHFMR